MVNSHQCLKVVDKKMFEYRHMFQVMLGIEFSRPELYCSVRKYIR